MKWQLKYSQWTLLLGGNRLEWCKSVGQEWFINHQINDKRTGDASIGKPIGLKGHHIEKLWFLLLKRSLLSTLHYWNTKIRRKEGWMFMTISWFFSSHRGPHETAGFAFYRIDIILHTNKPGQLQEPRGLYLIKAKITALQAHIML